MVVHESQFRGQMNSGGIHCLLFQLSHALTPSANISTEFLQKHGLIPDWKRSHVRESTILVRNQIDNSHFFETFHNVGGEASDCLG